MTRVFNDEAKNKLKQLISDGMGVLQEAETLNEGLNDTVKAIAEELEVKASVLKKAIRVAHKQKLAATNEENEELNTILDTVGRS